ncbi:hypothetical protein AAG906_013171 [Vitis piasezkii]
MAETKRYISKEELKTHNRVYNVSDWAKEHLGGSAPLLSLASQDAIDAFVAYHPGVLWSRLDDFFTGFISRTTLFRRQKGHGCSHAHAMAVMFSFVFMGFGFGWIGHDFGHYQVMMNRRLNRFAQVLSGNCLAELEDAVDGPGGMGQHPTPPRLERNGNGIPLTCPARVWDGDGK